jgi:hypothetical protein
MPNVRAGVAWGDAAPVAETGDVFPALRHRRQRPLGPGVELARRELWRAFQRGRLSEEELARTLDRLDLTENER